MTDLEEKLRASLQERVSQESLRTLPAGNGLVDFCSNDYLGFARSQILREKIREEEARHPTERIGSTGSRLISGNTSYYEEVEKNIAEFHGAESGLIFNSGYDANVGIFSSLPQRNDTVLYDKLVHASIRDGIRLSNSRAYSFQHNDVGDLERKLRTTSGTTYVAVESVYSMDGDCAPLTEMAELCRRYGAALIVDEAHATGVFGNRGQGRVCELGLQKEVFARLHTFGKALGSHGAIVLGSNTLRSYLINFARSFIYTTALPFHSLVAIRSAYGFLAMSDEPVRQLKERIMTFKALIGIELSGGLIPSESAIQSFVIPGNARVRETAREIQEAGYDVRPIMHPTVPSGAERLRICLHAFNTEEEIKGLITRLWETRK